MSDTSNEPLPIPSDVISHDQSQQFNDALTGAWDDLTEKFFEAVEEQQKKAGLTDDQVTESLYRGYGGDMSDAWQDWIADAEAATDEHTEPKAETECEGFQWCGQHFSHCDGCNNPYWEHTHDMQAGDGPFGSLVAVPITDAQRDACRAKWGSQ